MKIFATVVLLAAFAALVSGCRRSLREPPDWNLEKHLGQRNNPENRGTPASLPQGAPPVVFTPPPPVADPVPPPVAQDVQFTEPDPDAPPVPHETQPIALEAQPAPEIPPPPVVEPAAPQPARPRPSRYNVPRSTRRLHVAVPEEPEPETRPDDPGE